MSEAVNIQTGELVSYDHVLLQLAQARDVLEQTDSIDAVLQIRDLATAAEAYGKSKGYTVPAVNYATEILARSERRLGQLLAADPELGPGKGRRLRPLGLTKSESSRAQLLASLPDEDFETAIDEVKSQPPDKAEELTRAALRAKAKHYRREVHKHDRERQRAAIMPAVPTVEHADALDWLARQDGCDLLLTDPPYSTDVDDVEEFAADWLPLALKLVRPTGRAFVCIGAYPHELRAYLNVSPGDLTLANVLVWTYRNTLGPAPTHDYKLNWQAILYYRGPDAAPLDCPEMTEQFAVQDINAPDGRHGDRWHPWQKPDELAERFIRHGSREGELVLDPFAGTGTFLLAAGRLGRFAKGCEKNRDTLDISIERGCRHA